MNRGSRLGNRSFNLLCRVWSNSSSGLGGVVVSVHDERTVRARVAQARDDVDRGPAAAQRPPHDARPVLGLVEHAGDRRRRHQGSGDAPLGEHQRRAGHPERSQCDQGGRRPAPARLVLERDLGDARPAQPRGDPFGRFALARRARRRVDRRQPLAHLAQRGLERVGGDGYRSHDLQPTTRAARVRWCRPVSSHRSVAPARRATGGNR